MLFCVSFAIFFNITFAADILENICGRPSIKPLLSKEEEDIPLEEAIPHSWPWQASLQLFRGDRFHHWCGGTIVAQNKILSNAGCIFWFQVDYDLSNWRVVVGKHNLMSMNNYVNETTEEAFTVKNVSLIDGKDLKNADNMQENIGVLTLSSNLIFNDNIMPICLPRHDPLPDSVCYVIGWSTSWTLANYEATQLKQAYVPMSPLLSPCQIDDPRKNKSNLCYTRYSSDSTWTTKGPCRIPDGSLICKSSSGIWYQYGLIPSEDRCLKDSPTYYWRISFYYDWLQKQIYDDIHESVTTTKLPKFESNQKNIKGGDPICGQPTFQPVIQGENFKIVGGIEAKPHSWPWQISLQQFQYGQLNHICGGTIIARNKILCAAHCLIKFGVNPSDYKVIVGIHVRYGNEPMAILANIKNFSLPESFDYKKNAIPDDIMVITLTEELFYNEYVTPICLAKDRPIINSLCYVTGWGQSANATSSVISKVLRQVDIQIQDTLLCKTQNVHGTPFNDSTMICAGHREGVKDSCYGDSGGPLVCKVADKWYQYGIVSHGTGSGCGQKDELGVYSSVSYHYNWLQKEIYKGTH